MIIEAHHLLSGSWRPREASDVIESKSKGPRTRNADIQGQEETECPLKRREGSPFRCCLLVLSRTSVVQRRPAHW